MSTQADPIATGLLGGAFDPPHMAHVLVAAWALGTGEIDELWIIPSGGHPFGKRMAPFEDRLEMCRRAFVSHGPRVRVLEVEREPGTHYTIDTLRRLDAEHPGRAWRWIMGSDTLSDAPKWKAFDEVMRLAPPLVVPRRGHGEPAAGDHESTPHFALPDLSSTLIRGLLAEGRSTDELGGLAPRGVLDWIDQRGLYRG